MMRNLQIYSDRQRSCTVLSSINQCHKSSQKLLLGHAQAGFISNFYKIIAYAAIYFKRVERIIQVIEYCNIL